MKDLLKALDCEHEDVVIEGFMNRYHVSKEEAEEIFTETKKWLWLAAQSSQISPEGLFIDKPLKIIDEMWHNFILHTFPYYTYCMNKFNKYIHHTPLHTNRTKLQSEYYSEPENADQLRERKTKQQYSLIYDYLGPETLIKWYDTLPKKYTPEYISSIRKS